MEYFSKCDFLKNLTDLNLSNNNISDKGMEYFSKCDFLKNLTHLYLSNNNISDKGMEYFSKCDFLKNLTHLYLDNKKSNTITIEKCIKNNITNFPKLSKLNGEKFN
jgi:Leucine-rich repeat (LRR) protein